jgi:hypothetical protein
MVYEDDVNAKIEEYKAKGYKVQSLYDDKYRDENGIIDKEKGKLLAALKGVIEQFDKSSDIKDLYMAQYLLFNIINLAKNNWK